MQEKSGKQLEALKVVSATYFLIFLSLKESTCETSKKNLFHCENSFRSRENQV